MLEALLLPSITLTSRGVYCSIRVENNQWQFISKDDYCAIVTQNWLGPVNKLQNRKIIFKYNCATAEYNTN